MSEPMSKSFSITLIIVSTPYGPRRVGKPYRNHEAAKSWVPFVKAQWHDMPTRTKRIRVPIAAPGKTTAKCAQMLSERYGIDVDHV